MTGYVGNDGRIHVPAVRPDVAGLKVRIKALPAAEKEALRAWLAEKKIPDSTSATEAQVQAVNAELDRRSAGAPGRGNSK